MVFTGRGAELGLGLSRCIAFAEGRGEEGGGGRREGSALALVVEYHRRDWATFLAVATESALSS